MSTPESTPQAPNADVPVGVAIVGEPGTVTARRAGGLRDLALEVDPKKVGDDAALQHLAKAVNIAFQTDYGENYLEAVYQAAIVRRGAVTIVHREYFGYGDTWFGQLGRLIRSLELTMEGPDPASPEGRAAIAEKGPRSIRGLLNLIGRKLDLASEYEDRVPAYVEQMFDRLEASGIIVGWDRDDWEIATTTIGLDIRISRKAPARPAGEGEEISPAIPPPKR
ncbi:hypothetical protein [Aquisphaera insulae]|uniref:hypothetical protein n=1 Tax=Aquisphaera insulae TaxID=2712864 RepID=UPI0013ECF766|nr:hypothetical protein [Aquisphaera insulae]